MNGFRLRLRETYWDEDWRRGAAAALVSVVLICVSAAASSAIGLLLDVYWTGYGSPGDIWFDPLWPTYLLWTAALVLVATRRAQYAAVAAVCAAVWSLGVAVGTLSMHPAGIDVMALAIAQLHHVLLAGSLAALLSSRERGERPRSCCVRAPCWAR